MSWYLLVADPWWYFQKFVKVILSKLPEYSLLQSIVPNLIQNFTENIGFKRFQNIETIIYFFDCSEQNYNSKKFLNIIMLRFYSKSFFDSFSQYF